MNYLGLRERTDLERHEAKYLIRASMMPAIRKFIEPFCMPDKHARGEMPEYVINTLQLDSPDLILYRHAVEHSLNRFKLRIRTYESEVPGPVFLEIKRKIKGVVAKSRCMIPRDKWRRRICFDPDPGIEFESRKEQENYYEFARLAKELQAMPVVMLRYQRESYFGRSERYARVTMDRKLCYRGTRDWSLDDRGSRWWAINPVRSGDDPFEQVVLELKTVADVPVWMVELTKRFNLVRTGYCKYAQALSRELAFREPLACVAV